MGRLSILALADDLTGALEIGAKFANSGIGALVTTQLTLEPASLSKAAPVLVVDTETRHLEQRESARIVSRLAHDARRKKVRLIYKKADSTLRGNIAAELSALMEAYPESPLIYVPAYPRLGRTVKNGHLYVDGILVSESHFSKDALNPIHDSYLPRVLGGSAPVIAVDSLSIEVIADPAIYVVDGETESDVQAAADFITRSGGYPLAAGPAALAGHIADRIDLPRAKPGQPAVIRTCLAINGSRHPVSVDQVKHAEANGWRSAPSHDAAKAIAESGWVVLRTDEEIGGIGIDRANSTGSVVAGIVKQVKPDALIIFGGDTAAGIVKALECTIIYPHAEVLPGVPLSGTGELYLITKAGGFGPVTILNEIRDLLNGRE